jgi:hypothetical protein
MALNWPRRFDRTPRGERSPNRSFDVSLADAVADLEAELARLDADDWQVESGNQHTKSNGMPLYNANPDDPGFVVKWQEGGETYAVACDAHTRLRDNVRQCWYWLRATRDRGRRPVETGDAEYAAARLPPAEGEAAGATAMPARGVADAPDLSPEEARSVLRVSPSASEEEIHTAYLQRVQQTHPDQNDTDGSAAFERVQAAKQVLLDG